MYQQESPPKHNVSPPHIISKIQNMYDPNVVRTHATEYIIYNRNRELIKVNMQSNQTMTAIPLSLQLEWNG
jgi:hypothetical protein